MFEGTKLLAASTSAVEWYKSCAHTSFLSEVIYNFYMCQLNVNYIYRYSQEIEDIFSGLSLQHSRGNRSQVKPYSKHLGTMLDIQYVWTYIYIHVYTCIYIYIYILSKLSSMRHGQYQSFLHLIVTVKRDWYAKCKKLGAYIQHVHVYIYIFWVYTCTYVCWLLYYMVDSSAYTCEARPHEKGLHIHVYTIYIHVYIYIYTSLDMIIHVYLDKFNSRAQNSLYIYICVHTSGSLKHALYIHIYILLYYMYINIYTCTWLFIFIYTLYM